MVGKFVTPYLMWRLAWPLYTFAVFSIGLAVWHLPSLLVGLADRLRLRAPALPRAVLALRSYGPLIAVLVALLISLRSIRSGWVDFQERYWEVGFSTCSQARSALHTLDALAYETPVNVLASNSLDFCIPAYAPWPMLCRSVAMAPSTGCPRT